MPAFIGQCLGRSFEKGDGLCRVAEGLRRPRTGEARLAVGFVERAQSYQDLGGPARVSAIAALSTELAQEVPRVEEQPLPCRDVGQPQQRVFVIRFDLQRLLVEG